MSTGLYKTTIVIWTDYDPTPLELLNLAEEATDGNAQCSRQSWEFIVHPETDPDAPSMEFFFRNFIEELGLEKET